MGNVIRLTNTNTKLINALRKIMNEELKEDGLDFLIVNDQTVIEAALIELLRKKDPMVLMDIYHGKLK